MHHHDTAPSPRGVWDGFRGGRRLLDPEQLDRQDYLLAQLFRRGIYVNLNLHVGRAFTEQEGFVSRGLPRAARYDKYVLYFEPRMRRLFKEFCRAYLTRHNRYRKRRRVDDPGVAMIEITNENAFSQRGPELAAELPEPYRGEFRRQWNGWLARRYSSTAALRKAWGASVEPLGPPIADSAAWARGLGRWRVHQSRELPLNLRFGRPGPAPGAPALRIEIPKAAPQVHLHELQRPDLALRPERTHTLAFWARADRPRELYVDVSRQGPRSWSSVGLREQARLGTEWKRYVLVFRTLRDVPEKARICFKFGGDATAFELAGVSLRPGGELTVVPEGQSLEAANIDIPRRGWSEAALRDARQFMADTEKGFIREIVAFLKEELGVRVPVTASQITYHGPEIVAETCDYADIHAYWEHPRFPGRPWDSRNWFIPNTPMESAPERSTLLARTPWRLLDRPFTISEWNIPDPNDYAAGAVPFAALIAGLQDWDGVFFFQYHSSGKEWFTDRMRGYFSFNGQPAKLVLLAACAPMVRRGDIAPLREIAAGTCGKMLSPMLGLERRVGIDPRAAAPARVSPPVGRRLASPDGRAVWDATDPKRAFVRLTAPASRAVWGLIGGRSFDLDGVRLRVGRVERNYAAVVLTSLDGKPIERSRRLLLAAVGSAENQGMGWNAERTSVGNRWGTGPTMVNGVPLEIDLPFRARKVSALDGRGLPRASVPAHPSGAGCHISVGPRFRTLWYEITVE